MIGDRSGLAADHPRAGWLRQASLNAAVELPVPDEVFQASFTYPCGARFERRAPLEEWLVDLLAD